MGPFGLDRKNYDHHAKKVNFGVRDLTKFFQDLKLAYFLIQVGYDADEDMKNILKFLTFMNCEK